MIGRTSGANRFNIDMFSDILDLRGMKKVVGKRDDFAVDALFYFEKVHRFEYYGNIFNFEGSCYCMTREFCSSWR